MVWITEQEEPRAHGQTVEGDVQNVQHLEPGGDAEYSQRLFGVDGSTSVGAHPHGLHQGNVTSSKKKLQPQGVILHELLQWAQFASKEFANI